MVLPPDWICRLVTLLVDVAQQEGLAALTVPHVVVQDAVIAGIKA